MKFQTSKTIYAEDTELVLNLLELCLRELPLDSVRQGTEIAVHGLGPSPRVINHADTTILRVESRAHQTVITADVSFQPSCLLSDTPQELVVELKLDQIFDQVKGEIAFAQRRAASVQAPASLSRRFSAATVAEPQVEVELLAVPAVETTPPEVDPPAAPVVAEGHAGKKPEIEQAASFEGAQRLPPSIVEQPQPAASRSRYSGVAIAAVACAVTLVAGIYQHLRTPHRQLASRLTLVAPSIPATQQPVIAPVSSAVTSATDVQTWLQEWVMAMRSRDARRQSMFYADTVDNYLGKRNVSRAEVMSDKQNAIQSRSGLWTVKLERISLKPASDGAVSVSLVKHYIAQTKPAQISEQFIQAHLRLQRRDNRWQITSETEQPKRLSGD